MISKEGIYMNFFIELIKSMIFLTFPILTYLYFESLFTKKDLSIFLKISVISSIILYGIFTSHSYLTIFINLPLIVCIMKKYKKTYVLANIFILLFLTLKMNISIYFLLIEYIILFLALLKSKQKINTFIIITSYFYSFFTYYYYVPKLWSIESLFILCIVILNYLLAISIKYMIISSKNKYIELEDTYRSYLFKFIHEVKNPIAVCKGYLEMLSKKETIEKKGVKNYINIINKEIDESLNLMDDYLVFGRFAVNLDYMDLNLLLEDVYHSFKNLSESKDIKIDFDYDEEEVIILGDYNKLKQVLINIIKNSIEAKKDDNPLNIKIKLFKVENEIKIEVIDDGVGIKDVKQIGKEFYTTKINGTGLGVNFSKTIISMHKGKIKYSSTLGKGTKVLITLPLTEV